MLVVGLEEVTHVSDVVVGYVHKVHAWVRRVAVIFISSNHEVFADFFESLHGYVVRYVIIKQGVRGKGLFRRLLCLQEFDLVMTPWRSKFWVKVRTKTNRVGPSGIITIAVLGLSGTEYKLFSWYDVRSETNRFWRGCSGREDPIAMGTDTGSVNTAEIWDNDVGIC